eukprot:573297-Pelagomonas_calceolata.AAC.1
MKACQARGGLQQGGGLRIESLWPGWRKYALCRWEPVGGSLLNARGRTASVDLSSFLVKLAKKGIKYVIGSQAKVTA